MKIISDDRKLLRICKTNGITYENLSKILETPALTVGNIQYFLNNCDKDSLARMFYTSALVKISEMKLHAKPEQQPNQASETTGIPDSPKPE